MPLPWKVRVPFRKKPPHPEIQASESSSSRLPHPCGLVTLHKPLTPLADIVAIHGLDGHRENTWTASNGTHWLRDLLPASIQEARILCWGYDSRTHATETVSRNFLFTHAEDLLGALSNDREIEECEDRPIIFIAHSLGGIVLMKALLQGSNARHDHLRGYLLVKQATHAILFLGTPLGGSDTANFGQTVLNVAKIIWYTNANLVDKILPHSEALQELNRDFTSINLDFNIRFFHEALETPVGPVMRMIVPLHSAVIPGRRNAQIRSLQADHVNMVRYPSKDDDNYNVVVNSIRLEVRDISERHKKQLQNAQSVINSQSSELSSGFSIPFNIAADHSRVSKLIARETELTQMWTYLSSPGERRVIIISALGGMGKTQLALAHAHRHRNDYTAVLWMDASDEGLLFDSYREAAQLIQDENEHNTAMQYLRDALNNTDPRSCRRAVLRWLGERENNRWLMIFDNFDHPIECKMRRTLSVTKAPDDAHSRQLDNRLVEQIDTTSFTPFDIRPFLPATQHGAILITTRMSSLSVRGQPIQLNKFESIEESLALLEDRSNRKNLAEDQGALAVAQALDGLPLALASAGAYLAQHSSTTWSDYLEQYNRYFNEMAKYEICGYDQTLHSTWQVTYDAIEKKNQNAARLLRFWGYLYHGDLWYEFLRPDKAHYQRVAGLAQVDLNLPLWLEALTSNKMALSIAFSLLCDYGMANAHPHELLETHRGGYSIHSCVHAWAKSVLDVGEEDSELLHLSHRLVARCVPSERDERFWILSRRLRPHADVVWHSRTANPPPQPQQRLIDHAMALFFDSAMEHHRASILFAQIDKSGPTGTAADEDPVSGVVGTQMKLATAYMRDGNFEQAVKIFENFLSSQHNLLLNRVFRDHIKSQLGLALIGLKELDRAEVIFLEVIESQPTRLTLDSPDRWITMDVIKGLHRVYVNSKRCDKARELLVEVINGHPDSPSPLLATWLVMMTEAIESDKTYPRKQDALQFYEHAVNVFRLSGDWQPGWFSEPRSYFRTALKFVQSILDHQVQDLASRSFAALRHSRSLRLSQSMLPQPSEKDLFESYILEANLCMMLDWPEDGYGALCKARPNLHRFDGPRSQKTALVLVQFSVFCGKLGRGREFLSATREALEIYEDLLHWKSQDPETPHEDLENLRIVIAELRTNSDFSV